MSMDPTSDSEISAEIVHVVHVDESGTSPVRTYLALAEKDGLTVSIEGEDESFRPGSERRERRYRTSNTVDIEVQSPRDVNDELLDILGVVDVANNNQLDFSKAARTISSADNEYIELIYFDREDPAGIADAQAIDRYADLELADDIEYDASETPPILSWTWWVEGDIWWGYTPPA